MSNGTKGLDKALLDKIVGLITAYKIPEKIIIFGSRAGVNFSRTSDIDIAILGKEWTDKDINVVKNSLDEIIKTPLKFDVLDFYSITKSKLKKDILEKGRVIYGKD